MVLTIKPKLTPVVTFAYTAIKTNKECDVICAGRKYCRCGSWSRHLEGSSQFPQFQREGSHGFTSDWPVIEELSESVELCVNCGEIRIHHFAEGAFP